MLFSNVQHDLIRQNLFRNASTLCESVCGIGDIIQLFTSLR